MKVLSFLMVTMFIIILSSCDQQKTKIPEKVQSSFEELFPTAQDVEWEMEDNDEWEAEFEIEGKEVEASFSSSGQWLETEYEIESLPETIETIINETYPGFEIGEVEILESPEIEGFEVELENGEDEIEILISRDGEIMFSEVEEKEIEEDEEE